MPGGALVPDLLQLRSTSVPSIARKADVNLAKGRALRRNDLRTMGQETPSRANNDPLAAKLNIDPCQPARSCLGRSNADAVREYTTTTTANWGAGRPGKRLTDKPNWA